MLQNRYHQSKQENTDFVKQQLSAIEKPPETVDVSGGCPTEPLMLHLCHGRRHLPQITVTSSFFIHFSNGIVSILKVPALIVCLNLGGG